MTLLLTLAAVALGAWLARPHRHRAARIRAMNERRARERGAG